MATHNQLGKQGEDIAKKYLIDKGYKILETNWKSGRHEIDIIAQKYDFLSIVEVKTRTNIDYGFPESFVTQKKMRNMVYAAHNYLKLKCIDLDLRFEVIAIIKIANQFQIEHFDEAFRPDMAFGGVGV
jgi:putative endonuclease